MLSTAALKATSNNLTQLIKLSPIVVGEGGQMNSYILKTIARFKERLQILIYAQC